MKDNDIKTQLKKALKVIFEFSYNELYKEYSSANPLSDEVEFINYLIKNQEHHTDEIESKIYFYFNNEITTEEEYENIIKRDEFWFYKQYSTYLKDKLSKLNKLPPQQSEKPKPELNEILSMQITHPKRIEIAKAIKGKYSSYKGKDFKILYEALLQLDLFPKKGKRSVFFRCLQNESYNINNVQILEDKYFKTGYENRKGNYEKSEDEIQRDEIIEYLKTIIETK